jgi:hypothetical protein
LVQADCCYNGRGGSGGGGQVGHVGARISGSSRRVGDFGWWQIWRRPGSVPADPMVRRESHGGVRGGCYRVGCQ